jgi:hypothetical protein
MEDERRPRAAGPRTVLFVVWPLWLAVVLLLGAAGVFVRPEQDPPVPVLLGAVVPLAGFLVALVAWPDFRLTMLSTDPRVLVGMQAWRAAGLVFIALFAEGILPGRFAWPAGLGDMAVGLTAPLILAALLRNPNFVGSRSFVLWNLFGVLDLITAVTLGAISSGFVGRVAGAATTAPMARLPLVLIPAFFVPLLLMIHVVSLLQARQSGRPMIERPFSR